MNTDSLILRQNDNPPLTNKGAPLDSDDFDSNFIKVYDDLLTHMASSFISAYSASTEYDDTENNYVTYQGRVYKFISSTPATGETPGLDASPAFWLEITPASLSHIQNRDTILAQHTANEVTASEIRSFIDAGGTNTNIGSDNLTIDDSGTRKLILGGGLSTDTFEIIDSSDTTTYLKIGGNGFHQIDDLIEIGKNGAVQGALRVFGGGGSSSQITNMYNSSGSIVYEMRQAGNSALMYLKNSSGTNQITLTASSGIVDAVGGFSFNGAAGFTGTGAYTNFTIQGGIITAAS